ncbi:MAG TPA: peptidoglycan DD-metalloendopeptidase family protein [Candidatus Eubacterium faecale]|uniref:Peptidoglycan DD-metalloendopeptidase family protein n=1 Tax=Candidatus Eubacterium faecale TaxID=2838568 RepID=A0A9D2MFY8_9FIRM|nr:peptidoglycan DD-metalloendopeptidase family protein [Candidatus Eubacterium faecale]
MLVFSSAFTAQAKTSSQSKLDKINQNIKEAQKELDSLDDQVADKKAYSDALMKKIDLLQDKLDALESNRDDLQSEIDAVQKRIDETQAEINKAEKEIEKKEQEFDGVYEEYCQRLRAMYISGNVSMLEVLLESGDISSILTRAEMVKSVSEQDSATLDDLMTKMEEINKEREELANNKIQLGKDKDSLNSRKQELQKSIDEYNSSKAELNVEVEECNAALASLDDKRSEVKETLNVNQEQKRQIEAEINNALSGSGSNKPGSDNYNPGTGQLAYPTSYRQISAGYPNYSNGSYHGGVDWPCPTGTAVHASDSGVVVIAKKLTYSYGQYILIDHGNGLSTLYAHNSSLVVGVGDKVSKGQIIAYSGESGNATGPHVHFEVRLNGTRVNPMSYL